MNTFTDRWRQLEWDDIRLRITGKPPLTWNAPSTLRSLAAMI